jgi:hypothetical protein
MEVKIKQGNEMLDATIEMVDGVMVVSPKEMKLDVTKFKDGDVLTGGYDDNGGLSWTFILKGEIEISHNDYNFAEEYVSLDSNDSFEISSYSDAIEWVRYATEEEKKKLFDKLKEEGYEWKTDTKELVKLKWKPKVGDEYYHPSCSITNDGIRFDLAFATNTAVSLDMKILKHNLAFKTEEECQAFCDRLNEAINSVKP